VVATDIDADQRKHPGDNGRGVVTVMGEVEALRVVVVGAGVGGIAIARALCDDGHDVVVLDQRPAVTAGGGAVTIWPNGAVVLSQLGVDMDGSGQLLTSLQIAMPTGQTLATIDLATIGLRLAGPVRMVPRKALLERLLDGFAAQRIRSHARVVAISHTDAGVTVTLADGSTVHGDLLIGADGLHSLVRDSIGAAPAAPTGWCSWQGLITLPGIADAQLATQVVGERGTVGLWPAGGRDMQWWFDTRWSPDFVRPHRPVEMIRSEFAGWSDGIDQVLALLTDDDLAPSPFPHMRHRIPRVTDQRPVTLLGDAAHTMPPFLAQGTNQALLDTMVLRMVLRTALIDNRVTTTKDSTTKDSTTKDSTTKDVAGALRSYERIRRHQVGAVSWLASRQVSQKDIVLRSAAIIPDRVATWALTGFLAAVSHRGVAAQTDRRLAAGRCSHGPGLHQAQG
jgi:2-polyprenyl-6-methoxyphenol hydroxylase-like FAD-dependent oxidoreductase